MNLILDARNEDGTSVFNRNVWDHMISIVLYSIYGDTEPFSSQGTKFSENPMDFWLCKMTGVLLNGVITNICDLPILHQY